ncbi:arginine kinase 1 isoform X1 [Topomyia yanbarensis]|uniref:arginine kinase 1 isoform X1 n=2 Tax=Topomyia yanbarensis TaxID=2498891 RepID=UPI00273AA4A7|nr:arginine kinase 1 isoform X1 [Topomyia yanbarensis]
MFALWYFSLAVDELRKRFGFVNRLFIFFNGNEFNTQPPAIEPQNRKTSPSVEPVDQIKIAPVLPEPEASLQIAAQVLPKPVDVPSKPIVVPSPKPQSDILTKPSPVAPIVKPAPLVEPVKPKIDLRPTVAKPEIVKAKEQSKSIVSPVTPTPSSTSTNPQEPALNGKAKSTLIKPARQAPESKASDAPAPISPNSSIVVELPTSNEDSFIIVEKQKPKAAVTNVKDSTLDFLKAEGGRVAAPTVRRNKSDTMVDAAVLEKLEAGFAKLAASDSKSLLKKYLTKEVFEALKNKKTSFGSTLLDCIQSGVENLDSGVGIYAPDAESYSVFADLFDPIIEDYHKGFKKTDKHPACDFGDVNTFANVDPTGEFVVSTRVRCGRSMEGYPFNPCLTEAQYKEMEQKVSTTLSGLEGELKGKFYPLTGMEKSVQQQLIDDHFLFKEGDRFLQAANACRFWPSGRGIYHNDNKTFLVWCNEEDHLRIISMQMGGDLGQVYRRLVSAVNEIEKRVPFSHHDRLGFLTFCPTNLGTTIRASVHIKVPKLAKDYAKLESIADKYNLQVRGTRGEHSEAEGGIYDISNKRRMGLTEFQAVKEMYDGISELIKIEKSL